MINLAVDLQSGNTKYTCLLCLWDSRTRDKHWISEKWPERLEWNVGFYNVARESLVDRDRVLLSPFHIKLGLIKQYVKALNTEDKCFNYIRSTFPHLSDAKIKEGVFAGPDISKLMKDDEFIKTMTLIEKNAWLSFKNEVETFLGKTRDPQLRTIVSIMLQNLRRLGCLMSMKMHFMKCHLDYLPDNVGSFSEGMGERSHQDFHQKEQHYQSRWNENMMADYC